MTNGNQSSSTDAAWDHATHQNFYEYYAKESESETTRQRFRRVQEVVLRIASPLPTSAAEPELSLACGPHVDIGFPAWMSTSL